MAFLFIYIPFSSEIESVPYISFVRIVEAPVTSRVSSLYFKLSQQTDVRMQGPCVHPSGRGESSWSWITCLRSFFHLLFGVCHLPSGYYFAKKRLFSAQCVTMAALWKLPRSLCRLLIYPAGVTLTWKADSRFPEFSEGSSFSCVARDAGGFRRYLALSWHTA